MRHAYTATNNAGRTMDSCIFKITTDVYTLYLVFRVCRCRVGSYETANI
eukprot:SAG31_NODE_20875_length_563_cov_1.653017_2_plen_48_part_01